MNVREALARLAPAELRGLAESLGLDAVSSPERLPNLVAARLRGDATARRAVLAFLQTHGPARAVAEAPEPAPAMAAEVDEAPVAALPSGDGPVVKELREKVAMLEASLTVARREAAAAGTTAAEERSRNRELTGELDAARRRIGALEASLAVPVASVAATEGASAAQRRVEALEAELERLRTAHTRRDAHLADETRRLEGRRDELTRAVASLERRHEVLRAEVPAGAAAMGRFVRGERGGAVIASGRAPLRLSEAERRRLGLVDGMQVLVSHEGASTGPVLACDERPVRELFGEVEVDAEGRVFLATADGLVPLAGELPMAGALVKAVTLDGGEPPSSAEVERILSASEVARLLEAPPAVPRRRRRGKDRPAVAIRPPVSDRRVLIVGGDRVGTAYVDELARRGVAAEWASGFAGLVARRGGFGGASLVVLILSQASHTLARAVTEAAERRAVSVVRTTARGVAAVADCVIQSLGGDSANGSKEGA